MFRLLTGVLITITWEPFLALGSLPSHQRYTIRCLAVISIFPIRRCECVFVFAIFYWLIIFDLLCMELEYMLVQKTCAHYDTI
jgi:hypothetical protein